MGSFHDASDGPIPQHMLDSMPPEIRAWHDKMMHQQASGRPALFADEPSPPCEHLDYGRIVSAPLSWMSFRGKTPVYVRIGGLTSERGQHMNGKCGWAVKAAGRAGQESEIPNFKASYLGRFPLVSADFWTSDHLLERPRSVDVFFGTRARGTLTLKRR